MVGVVGVFSTGGGAVSDGAVARGFLMVFFWSFVVAYLDSTATLDEVLAQFEDTSLYDVSGDATMCREHIQSCRMLISRTLEESRHGTGAVRDSAGKYQRALDDAVKWLAARDSDFRGQATTGVVFADLSELRG
jgi:hypothetical protein